MTWGQNRFGQLGNGSYDDGLLPGPVLDPADPTGFLTGVADIALGKDHVLALLSDGTVRAWGYGIFGQLGDGASAGSTYPVQVIDPTDPTGFLQNVVAVEAGGFHSFALLSDRTLRAFGNNRSGQLGTGSSGNSSVPVPVVDPSDPTGILQNVVQVSGGPYTSDASEPGHSLALLADGTVRAWGLGNYGQLGTAARRDSSTPVQVLDPADPTGLLTDAVEVRAGGKWSVALLRDGTVKEWGAGRNTGVTTTPLPVTDSTDPSGLLTGVAAIGTGWGHVLALGIDGTVRTWGSNLSGQLGHGSPGTSNVPNPAAVMDPTDSTGLLQSVVQVDGGSRTSMAILADGTLRTWGGGGLVPVQVVDPADPTGFMTTVIDAELGQFFGAAVK